MPEVPGVLQLRSLTVDDLDEINAVIRAAVEAWPLPPRTRRLSAPLLEYDAVDLDHFQALGAFQDVEGSAGDRLLGVAVWDDKQLHGLYVRLEAKRGGVGRRLIAAVAARASRAGSERLLVKAQRVAAGYFTALGLPDAGATTDYPNAFVLETGLSPR
jgi:GNAT superfamily N-acetyltransferase